MIDQEKIGKFIALCRKENGYTQSELAEKLGITDRAVSKWENGKSMPDSSIMIELCELLKINVNELLTGEHIVMENYREVAEENMIKLKESEEHLNKTLLAVEVFIIAISVTVNILLTLISSYLVSDNFYRYLILIVAGLITLACVVVSFVIEQRAGYYQCPACNHKYVPTFSATFFAVHMGWNKKLVCPKCGKKSWQKKVLSR